MTFRISHALALAAAAGLGYAAAHWDWPQATSRAEHSTAPAPTGVRTILYYRNPMGRPDTSPVPKKDEMGMDYIPVYADEAPAGAKTNRTILYYRNPMGLADTSPVPKKDWMGMDYIPVYEGEEPAAASAVKIALDKVQKAGVRTEPARITKLVRPVRAPGIAKPNERTLRAVTLRADGFIEKLYANETGRHVEAGEPLFRLYSQEMLRTLIDYRLELKGPSSDNRATIWTARQKLENLEVPAAAVDAARRDRDLPMSFDWPSPATGVVMEKNVVEGQMAKAGERLLLIGDLDTMWVIADVPEHLADAVKVGASATATFHALPGETFTGKVTFVLHELDRGARTAKVRIEVPNPGHRIRHEMYADVEIASGGGDGVLAVPASALIDSGNRQVVLVAKGEGRFEPREVKPGLRGDQMIEIRDGLKDGEDVVVNGNFLIDAEANLQSALSAFTAGSGASGIPAPSAAPPATPEAETPPAEPAPGMQTGHRHSPQQAPAGETMP